MRGYIDLPPNRRPLDTKLTVGELLRVLILNQDMEPFEAPPCPDDDEASDGGANGTLEAARRAQDPHVAPCGPTAPW